MRARSVAVTVVAGLLLSGCAVQGKTTGGGSPAPPVAEASPISEAGVAAISADYLWVVTSAGGRIEGAGEDTGGERLTLTLTGVRDYATQFTDRPARQAYVLPTSQFAQKWADWFADAAPNAVLSFVPPEGPTPRVVVLELTEPRYDAAAATLTFGAVHLHRQPLAYPGGTAPEPPQVTPPETFTSGSLFVDPAAVSGTKVHGMGVSNWQHYYDKDYSDPSTGYDDAYFQAIGPSTEWVTNYGLAHDEDMDLVRAAHRAGLKVAVTPYVVWTASGPSPDNDAQIANAITLVKEKAADAVVIGNEVLNGLNGYPYESWAQDMLRYIARVHDETGRAVPVGTSYGGNVYDFKGEQSEYLVNKACDFVQITVHPANWLRDGGPPGAPITDVASGFAFFVKSYTQARTKMDSWGLTGTPLQIRETGWPSASNYGDARDAQFTTANAADYFQQVQSWATSNGVDVFWFMAVDEPQQAPVKNDYYELDHYEANWGRWHFTPTNPQDVFSGDGPWGTFTQKY